MAGRGRLEEEDQTHSSCLPPFLKGSPLTADLQQERWFVFSSWFWFLTVPSLASPPYVSGSSSLGVPPQLLLSVLSPLPRTSSVTSQGCLCVFQYSYTNLTRSLCWILSVKNDSWCVFLARPMWIHAVLEKTSQPCCRESTAPKTHAAQDSHREFVGQKLYKNLKDSQTNSFANLLGSYFQPHKAILG